MKIFVYISLFGLLLTMVSCGEPSKKVKEPYNESRELVPNPEGYKKDTSVVIQNDSASDKAKLKPN